MVGYHRLGGRVRTISCMGSDFSWNIQDHYSGSLYKPNLHLVRFIAWQCAGYVELDCELSLEGQLQRIEQQMCCYKSGSCASMLRWIMWSLGDQLTEVRKDVNFPST